MTQPACWLNSDEVRAAARRRLPRGLFELIDRGSEEEIAVMHNRAALQSIKLRTRVLRDVSARSTASTLLGKPMAMPVVVAPTGPTGLVWFQGETEMAHAAHSAGIASTVSTAASSPLETICSKARGRQWFQLYVSSNREASFALIDRARHAGYEALVVTVDSIVPYNRPFNARSGFSMPVRLSAKGMLDAITHPRWLLGVVGRYAMTTGFPGFPNYPRDLATGLMDKDDSLSWQDLDMIRRRWTGPLMVKGITNAADAERAVQCGADGLIVTNHGGIAFDSAMASIDMLEEVVLAVAGRAAVIADSGFRRGSDIVKALCLGADAVMLGRVPLFGLAAGGREGAGRALAIIQAEISHTMGVMGRASIGELDRSCVWREPGASAVV